MQRYFHTYFEHTNMEPISNVIEKRNYIEQTNNVIVTQQELRHNKEQKRNVVLTSFLYVVRTCQNITFF